MNTSYRAFIDMFSCHSFLNESDFDQSVYPLHGATAVYSRHDMDIQNNSDGESCTEIKPADINIRLNPDIVGIDIVEKNRTAKYGKRDRGYEKLFTACKIDSSRIDDYNESNSSDIWSLVTSSIIREVMALFRERHCINDIYLSILFEKDDYTPCTVNHFSEERDDVRNYKKYNRGLPSRTQMFRSARNAI